MEKFYFTFGSWKGYPFKNGYIIVEAESLSEAIALFRSKWSDETPNTVNCSDIYREAEWERETANHSMKYYGTLRSEFAAAEEELRCCFCGKALKRKNAHSAQPLNSGVCCSECNNQIVAQARINIALRKGK